MFLQGLVYANAVRVGLADTIGFGHVAVAGCVVIRAGYFRPMSVWLGYLLHSLGLLVGS